jgi:Putative serine esterase (DUF676)
MAVQAASSGAPALTETAVQSNAPTQSNASTQSNAFTQSNAPSQSNTPKNHRRLYRYFPWLRGTHSRSPLTPAQSNAAAMTPNVNQDEGGLGLYVFEDQGSSQSDKVDIIAVHGLNGHYERTWTASDGLNWLKDAEFLPKQIPNARIMSFGYNARILSSDTTLGIAGFAGQLLTHIQSLRKSDIEKKRPIIFICHSLGGLVVKKVRVLPV